ncbi:MAG: hypothetical protein JWQ87_4544 [Candidatus Sulfotelmatobacter sp.]|nr:hypothetical protein [Candidatus Sulfotelmatobacter sp.]
MASQSGARGVTARTGIIALCVVLALVWIALELSAPIMLKRFSRIERRIEGETKEALALRSFTPDGRPTVLLVGNSLLLEGVQLDALQNRLAPQCAVSRLGIDQTRYLDWYFGLRSLLEQGSRPSMIVLSLATDQLASQYSLEEAFAHRQMSARDLPLLVREAKLDKTQATSYFFAHWSNWLGDKRFIRQDILILTVPNFRELAGRVAPHGARVFDPSILLGMAQERLPELRDLAHSYGLKIVVLVPPNLREDYSLQIQQIGNKVGIPVWVPSPPGEFSRDLYRDGFHLNDQGSEIFTTRLANQIRTEIGEISHSSLNLGTPAQKVAAAGDR